MRAISAGSSMLAITRSRPPQRAQPMIAIPVETTGFGADRPYSHSIVAGGLPEMS
jgi:hypothetical protein